MARMRFAGKCDVVGSGYATSGSLSGRSRLSLQGWWRFLRIRFREVSVCGVLTIQENSFMPTFR